MFNHLTAVPRGPRTVAGRATLGVSVALHAAVIAGASVVRVQSPAPAPIAPEVVSYIALMADRLPEPRPLEEAAKGGADAEAGAPDAPERADAVPAERPAPYPEEAPIELPEPSVALASPVGAVPEAGGGGEAPEGEGTGAGEAELVLDSAFVAPPPALRFATNGVDRVQPPKLRNKAYVQEVLAGLYPARLQMRGVRGDVTLRFVITEQGRVDPASVAVVSVGQKEFALSALRALARFRFAPARYRGRAVPILIQMPISFLPGG